MIVAQIFESKTGQIERFYVTGHAGSDEYGRDLVCAAVSALTINFVNSVEELCHLKLRSDVREGYYDVEVPESADVQLLAKSLASGLSGIAKEYGMYIQIKRIRKE